MKTKLLLLIMLNTQSLTAMDGPLAIGWKGDMPDVQCSFGELQAANTAIRKQESAPKSIVTGVTVLGLYSVSKLGIAQEFAPALFPRSGTSTFVLYGAGTLIASGAAWVGVSYVRSLLALGNAHGDLQRALREMQNMKAALEELKNSRAEEATQRTAIEAKVNEAKINSERARQAMEATQNGVEQILANMNGALSNTVHKDVVAELTKRFKDLDELVQQIAFNQIKQTTAESPSIDRLTTMASELAEAAGRFETTNDHTANQAAAQQAVTEHKKKPWWRRF